MLTHHGKYVLGINYRLVDQPLGTLLKSCYFVTICVSYPSFLAHTHTHTELNDLKGFATGEERRQFVYGEKRAKFAPFTEIWKQNKTTPKAVWWQFGPQVFFLFILLTEFSIFSFFFLFNDERRSVSKRAAAVNSNMYTGLDRHGGFLVPPTAKNSRSRRKKKKRP